MEFLLKLKVIYDLSDNIKSVFSFSPINPQMFRTANLMNGFQMNGRVVDPQVCFILEKHIIFGAVAAVREVRRVSSGEGE